MYKDSNFERCAVQTSLLFNLAGFLGESTSEERAKQFALEAEATIKTNYFQTKMVCEYLFPLLKSGGRVVNVSSDSGFLPFVPSEDLRKKFALSDSTLTVEELDGMMNDFVKAAQDGNHIEKGWPNMELADHYYVSKAGINALSRIQQREMNKDKSRKDVAINYAYPGYVVTDMTKNTGLLTIDEGAKSILFAANLPPGTDIKGQFIWNDCSLVDWVNGPTPKDEICDEQLAKYCPWYKPKSK